MPLRVQGRISSKRDPAGIPSTQGDRMRWRGCVATALALTVVMPSWAANTSPPDTDIVPTPAEEPGAYRLMDARLESPRVAQATGSPSAPAGAPGAKSDSTEPSASEL